MVGFDADHAVGLAFEESFDGVNAETAGEDSVEGCWDTAALDVAEDGDADAFEVGVILDVFGDGIGAACVIAFGDDDDLIEVSFVSGFL